jgi:peptide/nickel transport system ATP-binding protein
MHRLRALQARGAGAKAVRAADGVDLTLDKGETVALLGESGSGKSVTLHALLRLHPGSARIEGSIAVDGRNVAAACRLLDRHG